MNADILTPIRFGKFPMSIDVKSYNEEDICPVMSAETIKYIDTSIEVRRKGNTVAMFVLSSSKKVPTYWLDSVLIYKV